MHKKNELYKQFLNSLKGKKLVVFGIGLMFFEFVHQYDGKKIDLLIDNGKQGTSVKLHGEVYSIHSVDELKKFEPEQVVILITALDHKNMRRQLEVIGYFNIFSWLQIKTYEDLLHTDASKFLMMYSAKQMQRDNRFKIAHIALHNANNIGDVVLNHCIRQLFNKMVGDSFFTMHHVDNILDLELVDIYNNHDAIIVGGSGLLSNGRHPDGISGWSWQYPNELLAKLTKPLIVYAVGYNYLSGEKYSDLFPDSLRALAKNSAFLGLRNHMSLNIVREIIGGGGRENLTYQPCPTTCIRKYMELPEKKRTRNVAVSIAFEYDKSRNKRRFNNGLIDSILMEIAKAVKEIHNLGYNIFITLHCPHDTAIIRHLYAQDFEDFTLVDMVTMSPVDAINFYRNIEMVISSRGHAAMIPFGVGTKIISLNGHPKHKAFLEDIDAVDWFVDTYDVEHSANNLVQTFKNIMNNSEVVENRLQVAQDKLWAVTVDNFKYINSLFSK